MKKRKKNWCLITENQNNDIPSGYVLSAEQLFFLIDAKAEGIFGGLEGI